MKLSKLPLTISLNPIRTTSFKFILVECPKKFNFDSICIFIPIEWKIPDFMK